MNESLQSDGAGAPASDTVVYLERDIFFNLRLGQLESTVLTVALNFRECILLRLLLDARVRKQAVIDAAWGDNGVVVTDASYHQLVRSLRKKFEEIGLSGQSIKTLPRFGLEYLRDDAPSLAHASKEAPVHIEISQAQASIAAPSQAAGDSLKTEKTVKEMPAAAIGPGAGYPSGKQRMKWPLRLLLWILPFFIGLMIGHLGYRGGNAAGLPLVKTLRAPPASSAANGPTRRFRCT